MPAGRTVISPIMTCLLALALAPGVSAQGGPVALGAPAVWVDTAGVERGSVTVLEILDPFTGHSEDQPPAEGTRYVVVTLAFEGIDGDGIDAYPPTIWLRDADGAMWNEADAGVPDDFARPALTIVTVAPGSRVTGYLEYVVPADAEVVQVLVQPEGGTLLIPADLGSARPEAATAVTVAGADDATAVATVSKVVDPYKAFAKGKGPPGSARFVMVTGSFQNTGAVPFRLERNGLLLRDVTGALWGGTSIEPAKKPKVREFDSISMGPGDRITGRMGYQVPKGVALDGVYYQGGGHLSLLASLSDPSSGPTSSSSPSASSSPAAALDCPAVSAWWSPVSALIERIAALPPFQPDAPAMDLAASEQMLEDITAIRVEHQGMVPPEQLVDVHRRLLGAFLLYERSASDQVASQQADDMALLALSSETFVAAKLVARDALAALSDLGVEDCIGS